MELYKLKPTGISPSNKIKTNIFVSRGTISFRNEWRVGENHRIL